ncbi:hypothetical protein [Isoptericola sediminis]|uniref:Uncharacterized protein n=1 Tax=Isoptericola sediminis TaxID=2733572 RepID=A0A849K6A7_9MICO|nr:hypothetical protein [Isoptericola sediminis]NNU27970.1 hypothetical protein [Isoptericola sediminis]
MNSRLPSQDGEVRYFGPDTNYKPTAWMLAQVDECHRRVSRELNRLPVGSWPAACTMMLCKPVGPLCDPFEGRTCDRCRTYVPPVSRGSKPGDFQVIRFQLLHFQPGRPRVRVFVVGGLCRACFEAEVDGGDR